MVNCPLCEAAVDAEEDELDEGDEFTCEDCGANLVVVSKNPVEIQPAGEDDEDEDEEEDDAEGEDDEDEEEEEEDDEEWS